MSVKRTQQKAGYVLSRVAAASALGVALTLGLMALGAWLILAGKIGESAMNLWLLFSVFLGSALTAAIYGSRGRGFIPCAFLSVGGYLVFLLALALPGAEKGEMTMVNVKNMAIIPAGCLVGMVTNLVKSNKSYINKSKRKRRIT